MPQWIDHRSPIVAKSAPPGAAMLSGMRISSVTGCVALAVALSVSGAVRGPGATDPSPAATAAAAPSWRWPISPPGAVLAPFEAPPGPYAAGHRGIDLAAEPGQAVLAPTGGVVQFAGVVVDRPVVTLRVGADVLVSMEPVATASRPGDSIAAGAQLGTVAHGGHCDGRCLHIGVRVAGEYVSPMLFFATVPPAVLLPLD